MRNKELPDWLDISASINRGLAQAGFRPWLAARRGHQQVGHKRFEMKTPIEPPSRLTQVVVSAFQEAEHMVSAIQSALEIAQHNIEPPRPFGFASLARGLTLDDALRMAQINHGAKSAQAITVDLGTRLQTPFGPLCDFSLVNPATGSITA